MLKTQKDAPEGKVVQLEGQISTRVPYFAPHLQNEGVWDCLTSAIITSINAANNPLFERDLTSEK